MNSIPPPPVLPDLPPMPDAYILDWSEGELRMNLEMY
eukprot:CAMPEP_0204841236 /NCGR_PEP_ID=MMETSP1346-20131115/41299_1 /ASSEMBLY_ACC=CAM_ASM_000771 /TAXON_ID=215587 /ORGANISM="Aplanochytrium stocchinoi, Strain GSBS06" /LENGTH=36 /DNA_ID= /DNA_START= /DNA_END= /DNA_ORIENTATION=